MYVPVIDSLVRSGMAYAVDVPGIGTFVCLDMEKLDPDHARRIAELDPPPVRYPAVTTRSHRDCVLWAPWREGNASPWGRGLQTVNLHYLLASQVLPV